MANTPAYDLTGSPLRMRGKGHVCHGLVFAMGITPAYAGKRQWEMWRWSKWRDHPCVCGEKIEIITNGLADAGSPLRMRGKDA